MKKSIVLLVALLVMSLGMVASARYHPPFCGWTDTETTTIYGSTGSVDITTVKTLYFDPYLQPEETLCVKWWVKNTGLCPVKIKVTVDGVPSYLTWKFYPGLNLGNLNPKKKRNVALCISMPCKACPNHSNDKFVVKVTFKAKQNQHRMQTP